MAGPPDFNGSNGSRADNETNGSKANGSKPSPGDRSYTPISRPAPPQASDPSERPSTSGPHPSASSASPSDLDPERMRRARQAAKRFYLILLAIGLIVGALMSVAVVALLNRLGLTDTPDRPILEQLQPDSSEPESSLPSSSSIAVKLSVFASPRLGE